MGTCKCVAESSHSSPETVTTLLTIYTSTQNKKFLKKKKDSHFLLQKLKNNYIQEENETLSEIAIVDLLVYVL